ncbi:Glycosyl transferases group 1 [Paenibacillus sp. UNCCL117]|uniref:glycosyltransferase family 4 protein n=1 Tax=unclassified Paenibacillus TaxID=185978 RepID=UPI000890D29C|nr:MULTISPECIES: glycosyltransferase family 4 protein [unclassified Paenibacillus]SDC93826.1 Glycosyl transferases group 1 [Paenibacillus sp. cl123]SFW29650.1 Glycosyl transferases group 1 [Paenibacillus sp. UNCCL117]
MKILFTFYNPSGGMETLNRIRCEILQSQGIECQLLYRYSDEGIKNIRKTRTHITNCPEEIARIIRAERFDVIVVCTDVMLVQTIRASGYDKTLIYEVHGLGTPEAAAAIVDQAVPIVSRCASGLLYPKTSHLVKLMTGGFPQLRHYCFDNPLDTENFGYEAYPARSAPVLAWVGRLQSNKNWEELLEIGARLLQTVPGLSLWMFGDDSLTEGDQQERFKVRLFELGIQKRVVLYPNVPHVNMADYLSIVGDSGGFLCSTSLAEGFGYAVAEALLCRCPVLTTDSDGVRSFIVDGQTGLFYPRGDVDRAVFQATRLLYNHDLRRRLRSRGERYIRTRFTPRRFVRKFTAMLRDLDISRS